jgi:hypothetical protein
MCSANNNYCSKASLVIHLAYFSRIKDGLLGSGWGTGWQAFIHSTETRASNGIDGYPTIMIN